MFKLTPDGRKVILFFILSFIFVLLIVINDFFLNWQKLQDVSIDVELPNELDALIEKISASPKNSTSFALRENINEIFRLMNNKQYEKLYDLLSDDFKENMFNNDAESFSNFMEGYADQIYSPNYDTYKKYNNVYMVSIGFIPYSNSDEDIINTSSLQKTDTFILTDLGNSTYKFSFMGFVGERKINKGKGNSLFNIVLNKTVLARTYSEFHFTVNNTSDKSITISPKQIYCYTAVMPRFYNHTIIIPAESSKDLCFYIGVGLSSSNALPASIEFYKIAVGEDEYTFSIDTKYYQDIKTPET